MEFNSLAVTGYLDTRDIPFWKSYGKMSRKVFLESVRRAIKGRKKNGYSHCTLQRETHGHYGDGDQEVKVRVMVNSIMAQLRKEGYVIDDERYITQYTEVYRWTILWRDKQ